MEILILVYIVAFIFWSGFGIWDKTYNRYPPWIILVDLFVSLGAVAGMLAYYLEGFPVGTTLMWKIIMIVMIGWEIWLGSMDYAILIKNPVRSFSDQGNRWIRKMNLILLPVFYLPCLWMFYKIAFTQ